MGIIYPNLKDVKEFVRIEDGTYPAKITEVQAGVSKAGNPKVTVKHDVNVEGEVRPRTSDLAISGAGAGQFEQLLRACGKDEFADKLRAGEGLPFDTDELVGMDVQVIVGSEMYQNELRDRIKGYLRA